MSKKSARAERRPGRGREAGRAPATLPARAGPLARVTTWLGTPTGFTIAASVIVALALAARLVTWNWIFGSGRVELVPADSHYYVRLARLHLAAGRPVPFDPFVGFPIGSENYWPPLHTLLVTILAAVGTDAETAIAFAGPIATVLWLVVLAFVGYRTIGPRAAALMLLVLALTTMAVEAGKVGNADHNVHEPALAALVLLLATAAVRGSARAALAAGVVAGSARLFTTTGFVLPGLLAGGWVAAALASAPPSRIGFTLRAATSGGAAVITLLLAVGTLGHPARLDYEALTLFHPLLACGLGGVAVAICARREGRPRAALAAAASALVGIGAVPALLRAAAHLARRDPLLAVVSESRPLVSDPLQTLFLFGPVLLLLPVALWGAAREVVRRRDASLAPVALGTTLFLVGAAAQARLGLFLIGAAAVLLPLGLAAVLNRMRTGAARWTAGASAVAMSTLLVVLVPPPPPGPAMAAVLRPTLLWMRDNLPPAAPDPWDYRARPAYGVLAPYDYGHFITLYAERPVLASTFSQTAAHVEANRVASDILSDTDEERAYARVRELRLAYVLAAPSLLFGVTPPDSTALLPRLLRRDSFGRFRPLHVSEERRAGGGRFATVFEVVEGAVLTGRGPAGATAVARLGDGYERSGVIDPAGEFSVRVSRPGSYAVSVGGGAVGVQVTEEDVRSGAGVTVGDARD